MANRIYDISLTVVDQDGQAISSGVTVTATAGTSSITLPIGETTTFDTATTNKYLKLSASIASSNQFFAKWTLQYKKTESASWTTVTKTANPASQSIASSITDNIPVNVTLVLTAKGNYKCTTNIVDSDSGETVASGVSAFAHHKDDESVFRADLKVPGITYFSTSYISTLISVTCAIEDSLLKFDKQVLYARVSETGTRQTITTAGTTVTPTYGFAGTEEYPVLYDLTVYVSRITSKTVTLNPNGGSVDKTEIECTIGETYGELPTPTYEGYVFLGWFDAEEEGNIVTGDTEFTKDSPTTLYAHWEKEPEPTPPSPTPSESGPLAFGGPSGSLAFHKTSGWLIYKHGSVAT